MGRLADSLHGTLYVDSVAIIYTVEQITPYCERLRPLWNAVDTGRIRVVASGLSFLECLVSPLRSGDIRLQDAYKKFFSTVGGVQMQPIDSDVIMQGALVRAQTRLKTPDAIHAATALLARVSAFVNNDVDFQRVPGLQTIVLSQLPVSNA